MSDIGLERSLQMELPPLPQQNSISSQSSVEDFLNNKLDIPFKVGDKVLVSGLKEGIVRFIGQADFARGVWVGVELKKAMGKNDGSVAGKRYFQCPAMHGLFVPVHKVEVCRMPVRAPPQPRSQSNLGDGSVSKSNSHDSGLTNRGSQESLRFIGPAASSASQRMKLGVTSLTGQKKFKEQEEDMKQLIKERNLKILRTKAQRDEMENEFELMENEFELMELENDRSKADLKSLISQLAERTRTLEKDMNDIKIQLMENQRRYEENRVSLEEHEIKVKMYFEQSDTLVEKVASGVKDLRWRAKTAELDAEDLRNKQKQLKRKIHKPLQVQRDLIAENQKLKNAKQENKKETASNEENQDVGLMSIGTGASLIEKDIAESQIDFLNADLESRLKIAESSKSMTDIDGTGQKRAATVRLFCDVLDLHDTDDCPMQNTTSSPSDASLHHGNRDEEQPYCSSCKVSGHSTDPGAA